MACTSNKFVINKSMSNEFIMTIKQNDSTLPMVIVSEGTVLDTMYGNSTPEYTVVPEVQAVEYQAAIPYQAEVLEQPYQAAVAGRKELYRVNVMNNTANVDYKVIVNSSTYTVNRDNGDGLAYPSSYGLLQALATLINANTNVHTYLDSNNLYIEGNVEGYEFTVNTTDNLFVYQAQVALDPIAEVPYIPYSSEVQAVAEVPAVAYSPASYTTLGTDIVVDTTSTYSNVELFVTITAGDVDGVYVGGLPVTPVDGVYAIGSTTEFVIKPTVATTETVPSNVYYEVAIKSTVNSDIFKFVLYNLATGAQALTASNDVVADSYVEVYDAPNGQIKIVLSTTDVSGLEVAKGTKADRYYLRPTYRLAIDCSTVNNGNFVAKVNEVYVEA